MLATRLTRAPLKELHGALYARCSADAALAAASAGVDAGLPLLLLSRRVAAGVEAHGVTLVPEAFPDLDYEADGALRIEPVKRPWDPERVARRAVRAVREGRIDAVDGGDVEVEAPTLCIHGDAPNAVAVARAVRAALTAAGVAVERLRPRRP